MALYDQIGRGYSALRRPDARIAAAIEAALGDAATVINVGAGAGSYEPRGKTVLAVEPSEVMIRQRVGGAEGVAGAAPCVKGTAEAIPAETGSADAAMAILSAHHWSDLERGLREMARVARKRVVLLTWVPDAARFWLTDVYFPEILAYDRTVFPGEQALVRRMERAVGPTQVTAMAIPHDCVDGMLGAHWRRPEAYLREDVRGAISSFSRIDAGPGLRRLREDLTSGRWAERNGELLAREALDVGYRIVVSEVERE